MSRGARWGLLVGLLVLLAYVAWGQLRPAERRITDLARQPSAPVSELTARVISDEDLPPEGTRSLFDHFLAQHDGLAWPFERLLAQLAAAHPDGQAPVSVLIPHGRSLLKGQADEALPRIIVAADFEQANNLASYGWRPRGQLFMGFVERANEIEVISYNEAAGRYEFQLVQNYCADCVPRIVYAQRAVCTTCHQGKAPIFPLRPWNETSAHQAVGDAIRAARGDASPYQGVPLQTSLSAPERIDFLTDAANFVPVTQRLWLEACGPAGSDCRRLALTLALSYAISPGSFREDSPAAERLKAWQREHLPAAGIPVPSPDLINRDPLAERQGLKGWWRQLTTRQIRTGDGATNNEDLGAFEKLPPLAAEVDPLTPRPALKTITGDDLDLVYGLAAMFTASDIAEIAAWLKHDAGAVAPWLARLPAEAFAPAVFSRVDWMQRLLGARAYCCLDTRDMSPPITSAEPPLVITQHAVLNDYQRYCFACHRGNPVQRLNFMSGADEATVLANIRNTRDIREVLDWQRYEGTEKASKLMPPADSVQYQRLRQSEHVEATLQRMRDAVPSLFGF